MLDNIVVQWVITLILVGYVSYTTYKSIRLFMDYKKNLPNFLSTHKDAKLVKDNPIWWYGTGLMAVLAFGMVFITSIWQTEQVYYFRLAYFCISIIFIGLALETFVRKRVYLFEDGIYYVGQVYRFRMMANFEVRKGIIQNIRILMNNKDNLEVSKKMGVVIKDAYDAWKKNKKEKKR